MTDRHTNILLLSIYRLCCFEAGLAQHKLSRPGVTFYFFLLLDLFQYLITLKFLIEEQTQIREQGVLFLKFTIRAGLNKRAGWEKSDKILNEHALLLHTL